MRVYRLTGLIILALVCLAAISVQAQSSTAPTTPPPIWQAGSEIHDKLFDAEQAFLNADGDPNPATYYQQAASDIEQALALYQQAIQPPLKSSAPDADQALIQIFSDAKAAATKGDAAAFAYASGSLWTTLLRGSYEATLNALQKGDSQSASDWLRLREYRQATKFSLVDNPAAQAIGRLEAGSVNRADVIVTVSNDLRDAYTFRLRDALSKLKDAAGQNFATRSADWAGQISGYFSILQPDVLSKLGDADTHTLEGQIASLKTAALGGNLTSVASLDDQIKTALINYQPVALTTDDIAKRAQLLYLFIGLVSTEYARGVQDGQVTIPIEVQEATSFRDQAAALSEELHPVMTANDSDAANALTSSLDQMKSLMASVGSPDDLQKLVNTALDQAKQALKIDASVNDVTASYTIIDSMLKDMKAAVLAGDYDSAEAKRLEAYAILDGGIEQRLRGFAPDMALEVESLFWQGTSDQPGMYVLLADHAPIAQVQAGLDRLNQELAASQTTLDVARSAPGAVIGNSAVIVFREGLEAVLILSSLMAGMRAAEAAQYRRSLALGGMIAMGAAVITWLVFTSILSALGNLGDRLGVVVSVIAIAVLLLITNWFFHKTYWVGWMANFHSQKSKILGGAALVGPSVGLIILGFTSVYREVFETVLFLQSLILDAGSSIVLEGVALGLIGVAVVGFLTFKLQMRLPYKRMLVLTGILIGVVLVTMVGNTIHEAQLVGWLPITPIGSLNLPIWLGTWFGTFATWQGFVAQFAAAVFVIGSYFLAERLNQHKRVAANARRTVEASKVVLKPKA